MVDGFISGVQKVILYHSTMRHHSSQMCFPDKIRMYNDGDNFFKFDIFKFSKSNIYELWKFLRIEDKFYIEKFPRKKFFR